eukprot:284951-Amphidinium_carterae.1
MDHNERTQVLTAKGLHGKRSYHANQKIVEMGCIADTPSLKARHPWRHQTTNKDESMNKCRSSRKVIARGK